MKYKYDNSKIKIGDIFYSSWGYDQTNVDYYKVKKLIGKASVQLVPVENRMVQDKSNAYSDAVVPYPVAEGKPFTKKIKYAYWDDFKEPRIKLNSYANAYVWDGEPKMQTSIYHGR